MGINQYPTRYVSDVDVVISGTAPTTPDVGDIWVDTSSEVVPVDVLQSKIAGPNLLHNGAMQIHQRGTSTASITTAGYYTADRWKADVNALGTWTQSVENDAPAGSGLRKSLKMLCTTADASPAAGDYINLQQIIEGQNVQSIKKGTASAEQLTASFWVKSNKTGTYILEIYDADNGRQVSSSYTINASDTWEKKTITFPTDTAGAFNNDNEQSLYLVWWLGSGSNFTSGTLNTSWASSVNANRVVGQTNLGSATNQYIQFTGVQLETGSTATSFQFKNYETELAECQRYYYRATASNAYSPYGTGFYNTTNNALIVVPFPVTMRALPASLSSSAANTFLIGVNGANNVPNTIIIDRWGTGAALLGFNVTGAAGSACVLINQGADATSYIGFSADL